MLQLKNETPFEVEIALFPDEHGVDTLYVTVKATFKIGKTLTVDDEQIPMVYADEYWGEPGQSSLKYAAELHLIKPSTDIVLIGHAQAPDRQLVKQLDVTLSVADQNKTVRVFGNRQWESGLLSLRMTPPEPFEMMPLIYERAFGGFHEINAEKGKILFESLNPVGSGFVGKRKEKEIKGLFLPNLEAPASLISQPKDQPPPAGFGYIAGSWEPRKLFAGTYDEIWQKTSAPYLPKDFNPCFFNAAHPDLICKSYLQGGEPVALINVSPHGPLNFKLPSCGLVANVRIAGSTETPPLNMETVLFEPDQSRFFMIWRGAVACDKSALKVEQIDVALQHLDLEGRKR
ncbi:DUF2169 family type VI secretion system accessory protein [Desulfonema magnum]|uniref:DUF2169 n=1 Tax=Desulfonema magnum TaxID=45655 RepID=A0A975BI07_9BACT|nr:DUF2169 domain-containing protein [Desulfonema magnum]QTA85816.1 DUF2169 [Desulfonema magnum]